MILSENDDRLLYWLWLSFACGAGSGASERLLDYFDNDIEKIYSAGSDEYSEIDGLTGNMIAKLSEKDLSSSREILAYCRNEGIGILTSESPFYPARLARIQSRPIVLYYKGTLIDLDKEVCISAVGTRDMSEYGARGAYSIAYDLAKAGAVVVSGMAKGVDGMSHRGALDAGGYTVAVLGCGLDRAYPSEHAGLMQEIIKSGIVFSEFRPFTAPLGKNFPIRNRIISGLSLGTLVVEAPAKSGALITAQTALNQGRDVFALPGMVGEFNSTGTNDLIKKGAHIITGAADILLEYQTLYGNKINLNNIPSIKSKKFRSPIAAEKEMPKKVASPMPYGIENNSNVNDVLKRSEQAVGSSLKKQTVQKKTHSAVNDVSGGNVSGSKAHKEVDYSGLPEDQKKVLRQLENGCVLNSDQITERCGLSIGDVLASLTMLEIAGKIIAMPGGLYQLS